MPFHLKKRKLSRDQLSQGPITANRAVVFYTVVTQKYAIKSHLTSLLSSRNHSTIPISVYCKNCENTIR